MFNPSYLILSRHSIYYFRFPLPAILHPKGKRTEIKCSLGTRCPKEALHIGRYLAYYADSVLKKWCIQAMDYQDIRDALTNHFMIRINKIKEKISKDGQFSPSYLQAMKNSLDFAEEAVAGIAEMEDQDQFIESFIKKENLNIDKLSPEYKILELEYLKAYRDFCKNSLEFNDSLNSYDFEPILSQRTNNRSYSSASKKSLSLSIDSYMEERERLGVWSSKSIKEFRSQFNLLLDYLRKDASLHLTSEDANSVKAMLLKIPKQCRIKQKYKNIPLRELIKLPHGDGLNVASINKHLQTYSAFYDWAVSRKDTDENNFRGLLEKRSDKNVNVRDAYTDDQLKAILNAVTDHSSEYITKDYQKWGVLIGMYSGARLNEIAQLQLSDIVKIDDIWCFSFNDEGDNNKRLKNKASKRNLPIHKKLIELGIFDYIDNCRNMNKDRLLHELSFSGSNGYGRNLSRWFNDQFLVKLGMKKPSLVYHSFRHTFSSVLLQQGIEEPIVKAIIGHAPVGTLQKIYAKGYKTKQIQEAIEQFL